MEPIQQIPTRTAAAMQLRLFNRSLDRPYVADSGLQKIQISLQRRELRKPEIDALIELCLSGADYVTRSGPDRAG